MEIEIATAYPFKSNCEMDEECMKHDVTALDSEDTNEPWVSAEGMRVSLQCRKDDAGGKVKPAARQVSL